MLEQCKLLAVETSDGVVKSGLNNVIELLLACSHDDRMFGVSAAITE